MVAMGISIDILLLDTDTSTSFPVHVIMLNNDMYWIENLDLSQLPLSITVIVALPLKIHNAAEIEARVIAFAPR